MSTNISYKLPCGSKMNYPEKLGYLTRKGNLVVFHSTSSKDYESYLIVPTTKGIHIMKKGSMLEIALLYENLPLEESEVKDSSGVFNYKLGTTLEELQDLLAQSFAN
ncbi:hypothetical protein [Paenibacillus sp. NPDC058174]|uniref:hypothetical protein n=1 Tax=Paenibacillus sp. NPDC058174 TaxID=3346366 RepID=UPI0036DDE3B5